MTTIDRISLANALKHMNDKKTNTLTPLCKNKSLSVFRVILVLSLLALVLTERLNKIS